MGPNICLCFIIIYAHQLYSLGELCGLMPEDDIQPTSEQLTMVLDLTSGMGIADDVETGINILLNHNDLIKSQVVVLFIALSEP